MKACSFIKSKQLGKNKCDFNEKLSEASTKLDLGAKGFSSKVTHVRNQAGSQISLL